MAEESYHKTQIIQVIRTALRLIDPRLVDHGERVAYIAKEIFLQGALGDQAELETLMLLSVFHDIGAYKTEEIDQLVLFESNAVWRHSVYGYLFLKHLTSLKDSAISILYHHLDYRRFDPAPSRNKLFACLICLADRIDILSTATQGKDPATWYKKLDGRFDPQLTALFLDANQDGHITAALSSGAAVEDIRLYSQTVRIPTEQVMEYFHLLIDSIDFRSEHTVTHTINTTVISRELAMRLGISGSDLNKLQLGALLHDVGKIGIPEEILEYPGRLTPAQMAIMRTHVELSEQIIRGLVSEEICRIAVRHHERPDGSGYPRGLTAADTTQLERIVAVADVTSALTNARSYKTAYSKEKTLAILGELGANNQLGPTICALMLREYDGIMDALERDCAPVLALYDSISAGYVQYMHLMEATPQNWERGVTAPPVRI